MSHGGCIAPNIHARLMSAVRRREKSNPHLLSHFPSIINLYFKVPYGTFYLGVDQFSLSLSEVFGRVPPKDSPISTSTFCVVGINSQIGDVPMLQCNSLLANHSGKSVSLWLDTFILNGSTINRLLS